MTFPEIIAFVLIEALILYLAYLFGEQKGLKEISKLKAKFDKAETFLKRKKSKKHIESADELQVINSQSTPEKEIEKQSPKGEEEQQ